jgi:hypothetical protein
MNQRIARRVVIWIDHHQAILITFAGDHPGARTVLYSGAEPHIRDGRGSRRRLEAHRQEALRHFYKAVARPLEPGDTIVILGSGMCKHEFRRHIERHQGLAGRVMAVIAAPRLTDAELIACAEAFFDADRGGTPSGATEEHTGRHT